MDHSLIEWLSCTAVGRDANRDATFPNGDVFSKVYPEPVADLRAGS